MKITIIGTGNVGSALAKGWANAGHEIYLGVRNLADFKGKELLLHSANIKALLVAEAVKNSEIIVIAATPPAVQNIIQAMGDVATKMIIDTMNSVRMKPEGYTNTTEALMALTNCPDIVKCFNTTGAENMLDPIYHGTGIDMWMSGDSLPAKNVAEQLAKDLGFENCYDFGDSTKFNLQEQFALAWINLAIMQGLGRDIAFKVVKR